MPAQGLSTMQGNARRPWAATLLCGCLAPPARAFHYMDWMTGRTPSSAAYPSVGSFTSDSFMRYPSTWEGLALAQKQLGVRLHFATWATEGFEQSAKDLCDEAAASGVFVETHCFDEVPDEVLSGRWNAIRRKRDVDTQWLLLPALTQHILRHMPQNEVLLMASAGVELSADAAAWTSMLEPLQTAHIVAFQRSDRREYEHTKADVFREFGVWMDDLEVKSYQITDSYFFVRNVRPAHLCINNWAQLMANPQLLTDKASHAPNHEKFVEHRHEASLWSMLIKANHKRSKCLNTWKTADLRLKILPYRGCDDLRPVDQSPIRANCARQREGMERRIKKIRKRSEAGIVSVPIE